MIELYRSKALTRASRQLPPLPLTASQTSELVALLENGHAESDFLLELLERRVEPGVSYAAKVKAAWLGKVASEQIVVGSLPAAQAVVMLSGMGGGYNIPELVQLLHSGRHGAEAAAALKMLTKVYEAFDEVACLADSSRYAKAVIESWARAEWFTAAPDIAEEIRLVVYKVEGEVTTDDFSPGNQAQSRADIPLHATFFGAKRFPGGIETIAAFRSQDKNVCFAGDVLGTGSSRKSAINSLSWHIGNDLAGVPNKRGGGVVLAETLAPIFYATARDAGLLPLQGAVSGLATGDEVIFFPRQWKLLTASGVAIEIQPPPATLLDEYRAGGRLNLIIGKSLTRAACTAVGAPFPDFFTEALTPAAAKDQGYTLAQKIVGRACGLAGVLPATACEPKISTVGSQDTTGPMTMQEIAELACQRFKTDFFLQSFCHTAAYPKKQDLGRWEHMREITVGCGGVALKPGDGVIHSWLNKVLVPDQVGTGGDSHTRFPLGISFPAGSGLVAFAAALGFMPLEMPESVLVTFKGSRRPGITVRDMVNAIPYFALQNGLLSVAKRGKRNVFSGTVLEIEGVDDLSVAEAFELSDASAERNAAACTIRLPVETVVQTLQQNLTDLKHLIDAGYEDSNALARRISEIESWLKKPELLVRDDQAVFKEKIEIDLDQIDQPILACPNDPDDVRLLSECAGETIDEVFIGSCMTHLDHLQRAARLLAGEGYSDSRLWLAPSTRLDHAQVEEQGALAVFAQAGARVEIPGCSLCMGNQARVKPGATVYSTSTRNFDNRLGDGARVYLGSSELAVMTALRGALPTVDDYFSFWQRKMKPTQG